MASKDVAFVLIPGAFSPPSFYDKVAAILQSKGHTALPTQLQSAVVRTARPAATLQDDVDHIHSTIVDLLDQDKNVVLAMNSFGGFPGSQAAKGLSRAERGEGNGGALIGLVYLASFLPTAGSSLASLYEQTPGATDDMDDGYRVMVGEGGADWVFNDLPAEQREGEFAKFVNHSTASLTEPITYEGYNFVPSTYVICELDQVIPPAKQHEMIETANRSGAGVKTVTLQSGHCPMVSHPDRTAEILLEAAGLKL